MALILEIVLGLMIVGALMVAFFSARTWPIYQVVLVVFVFLSGVAFFYLSARTLATHTAWRTAYKQRQAEVVEAERQKQQLIEGGGQGPNGEPLKGSVQLRQELLRLTSERGGMFTDVAVAGVKDGVAQLTFKSPPNLAVGTVVFAFDQAKAGEGGKFQGEFKVTALEEGAPSLQVAPNVPRTGARLERLNAAKGPWVVYTSMPIDDAAVLAALDEGTRKTMLPASSVEEYAQADRALRDFERSFHDHNHQQVLLSDSIRKVGSNLERTEAATKRAEAEVAYRTQEKSNLQADLDRFLVDQKAILAYEKSLEDLYRQVRDALQQTYLENKRMAAELTVSQLRAADAINAKAPATP